jgi:gephyrin
VRPPGFDIAEGSTLLRAGDVLGSAELGLLGYAGWPAVQVRRAARVAVLSTGDELLDPLAPAAHGAGLRGGCVFDSNRPALLAAVLAAGARPIDLGVARDGPAALDAALDAALGAHDADVLVCSGGVSMGDRDLVKPLLARRGATHFGKVWMKPGKPLTFATVPRATAAPGAPAGARAPLLVFGLPGNPVSAYVCFHLVVLPALRQMQGASSPGLRRVAATTVAPIQLDPERPEYHRATLVSGARGWEAHSTGGQISSRLLSCSGADALLELPPAAASLPAGTRVSALLIGDVRSGAGWRHDALPHPIDPLAADGAHAGGGGSGGFRLALVCGADAASSAAAERTSAWLTARLAPDCWQAVRLTLPAEAAADESVCAQALRPLLEGEGTCGLLLLFGATGPAGTGLAAATRALTSRAIPSLGSVLRAACLPHAPAAALLGASCDAALAGSSLLLSLPAAAAAAEAGLAALLPSLPHALAQAGAPGLLRLRSSLSLGR